MKFRIINSLGCDLGTVSADELSRMIQNGTIEVGDKIEVLSDTDTEGDEYAG